MTTHWMVSSGAWKSALRVGIATDMMVESKTTAAAPTRMATMLRVRCGSSPLSDVLTNTPRIRFVSYGWTLRPIWKIRNVS